MGEDSFRAWAVRPKPHGTKRMDEFLGEGIVAIGWPMLGDLSDSNRSDIKDRLRKAFPDKTERGIGAAAGQIDRLANEMEVGDLVVAPDGGTVFVGRIASEYRHDEDVAGGEYGTEDAGYPHQRRVDWLHEGQGIPRSLATGKLYDALKCRLTVFELPADDVEDLQDRAPVEDQGTLDDLQERYLDQLQGGRLPGMTSNSFEDAVRIVLSRHFPGLSRQATSSDDEGDTDLLTELPGNVTVRVQVKYYDPDRGAVGPDAVEQLADSMDPGDNGLLVTSGTIGDEAEARAQELWTGSNKEVHFIDGSEFVDLVFENLVEYDEEELNALALRRNVDLP